MVNFFERIFSSVFKPTEVGFGVQAGTQKYKLKQFPFLFDDEPEFLSLYKELFDNVPILDNAIDTYTQFINPGYTIKSDSEKDIELTNDVLKKIKFPGSLSQLIQNSLIFGYSGSEVVLSTDLAEILRLVNVPSTDLRIYRNDRANVTNYYEINTAGPYINLTPERFIFLSKQATTDEPYGRSLFKSLPFLTRIMLQMQDSIGKISQKYGSPRFHVNYIPGIQLDDATLGRRLDAIREKFNDPKVGEDFFSAGDVDIKVIGSEGQTLRYSIEMSEIMQGVMSGLKLPAGVLGYNYGSTETHLTKQLEILLGRIDSYQKYYASELNMGFMPLLAKVYNLSTIPELIFDKPIIADELQEATTESLLIQNTTSLLNSRLITPAHAIERLKLPKLTTEELNDIETKREEDKKIENGQKDDDDKKDETQNQRGT